MNRSEWLAARKNGIGASEAACIVGLSPFKTNVQLWEEKTGRREAPDISDNPRVKYGTEAEEYLRALFALDFPEYAVMYDQFGMIRNNPDLPFAFATLDGDLADKATGGRGVLEIKTAEINRTGQWAEWGGQIPQHYYVQVCHQLLTTGYDFAVLKAQIKHTGKDGRPCFTTRHYFMERKDLLPDMDWLAEREIRFWECVKNDRRPDLILPEI